MGVKRQKTRPEQLGLAFPAVGRGEAPSAAGQGSETPTAKRMYENPADTERLMEEVCERENCQQALQRVKRNKGAPGVDGMTVHDLPGYLKQHWTTIREQLLKGAYQPQPVKRVEIDKPDGGGVRKLGVPTVLDRFIQQAVLQVLQYVAEGYRWVIDLDLEKFFDRVCHDRLMSRIAARISDRRVLKLIRAFLVVGVMEGGLVSAVGEGVPQGGPLSPLLSNLVLDEWDQELERRGHRFVRYADDSNVYVRSERAGQRVMASLTAFITDRLKLKVNHAKSAVARPWQRKFLGFSFTGGLPPRRRIAPKAVGRFKQRVRELTGRARGVSLTRMVEDLSPYLRGWRGYFGFCQTPTVLRDLEQWLRRRLRAVQWVLWKHPSRRYAELRKRGVWAADWAAKAAASAHGPWRMAHAKAVKVALPDAFFDSLGLPRLLVTERLNPPNRRMRTRMSGGVAGARG